MERYIIEKEESSWFPSPFRWFWRVPGKGVTPENPLGRHGAYPARWIAVLSAKAHTR